MQSLLIMLPLKERDHFLAQIEEYYSEREDVTLLRYGTTRRTAETVGFIWVEFEDDPPDQHFLSLLGGMKPALRFRLLDSVVEGEEEDEDWEEEDDDDA